MDEHSMIASPNGDAVSSFINASMASLNESFFLPRITQNDESLLSPAPCLQSSAPHDTADLIISENVINAIRNRVMQDAQVTFTNKAVEFFQQFESQIESFVDMKMNGSTYSKPQQTNAPCQGNCGALDEKLKKFDERYDDFIDKYTKFNRANDKKETLIETLNDEILAVKADIKALDEGLKHLQMSRDEEIAKQMQEPPPTCFSNLEMRVNSLEGAKNSFEGLAEQFEIQLDSLEQYNRQYIVNFEKIVNRGTRKRPEDATQLIINFLRVRLGINITNRDISICHRQDIPSERKKLGRKFIAPIYCKFLHRSLVHEILSRKHQLKNTRNEWGEPYAISQNLTLNRRLLLNVVEEKLGHFQHKWVRRGGDILVRKTSDSKAIKVVSERVIDNILAEHPPPKSPVQKVPSKDSSCQRSFRNKCTNRYADAVTNVYNHNFSLRRNVNAAPLNAPFNRSLFSQRPVNSAPIFTFREKSFVNYRSSAF